MADFYDISRVHPDRAINVREIDGIRAALHGERPVYALWLEVAPGNISQSKLMVICIIATSTGEYPSFA